jgi:hypothetical protein
VTEVRNSEAVGFGVRVKDFELVSFDKLLWDRADGRPCGDRPSPPPRPASEERVLGENKLCGALLDFVTVDHNRY